MIDAFYLQSLGHFVGDIDAEVVDDDGSGISILADTHAGTMNADGLLDVLGKELPRGEGDDITMCGCIEGCLIGTGPIECLDGVVVVECRQDGALGFCYCRNGDKSYEEEDAFFHISGMFVLMDENFCKDNEKESNHKTIICFSEKKSRASGVRLGMFFHEETHDAKMSFYKSNMS